MKKWTWNWHNVKMVVIKWNNENINACSYILLFYNWLILPIELKYKMVLNDWHMSVKWTILFASFSRWRHTLFWFYFSERCFSNKKIVCLLLFLNWVHFKEYPGCCILWPKFIKKSVFFLEFLTTKFCGNFFFFDLQLITTCLLAY